MAEPLGLMRHKARIECGGQTTKTKLVDVRCCRTAAHSILSENAGCLQRLSYFDGKQERNHLLHVTQGDGVTKGGDLVVPSRDELLCYVSLVARFQNRLHDGWVVDLLAVV